MTHIAVTKPCRSKSPDDEPCKKLRGHKSDIHQGITGDKWLAGIKTPAHRPIVDDGYRSEGDYQSWMRYT